VEPTHYGLGKHGWVTITATDVDAQLKAQFDEWIAESFEAVAPRKLVDQAKGLSVKAPARKKGARAAARSAAKKR
jgi:hypothetical protein